MTIKGNQIKQAQNCVDTKGSSEIIKMATCEVMQPAGYRKTWVPVNELVICIYFRFY